MGTKLIVDNRSAVSDMAVLQEVSSQLKHTPDILSTEYVTGWRGCFDSRTLGMSVQIKIKRNCQSIRLIVTDVNEHFHSKRIKQCSN